MANELLVGAVGIAGALLGAGANAFGSNLLNNRKFLQDSRYKAYMLYLNSMSLMGASPPGSAERWRGVAGLIEAKCQISLFGSPSVVEKLSEFSAKYHRIEPESYNDLAEIIREMRSDCGSREVPELPSLLRGLLFEVGD
jgi:hypothetical protein